MKAITKKFTVDYQYSLQFTDGLFDTGNRLLASLLETEGATPTKVLFVVDDGVVEAHPRLIRKIDRYCETHAKAIALRDTLVLTGGEASKNEPKAIAQVLAAINDRGICRHSFVVAVGGGALIDMVGYAANTAHRGVKLIRVPTTVLAQNDASVGVKNSINAFGKKNFLGTFALPYAIINDYSFLATLEQRDWISGIAEAIKVALIKDSDFFDFIKTNANALAERDKEAMQTLIHRCAEIHMDHIAGNGDPFESGSSRPLDFGHWAAHKLEQMTAYNLRHGEAVAMGIALDVTYSHAVGLIDGATMDLILEVFETVGFDIRLPIESDNDCDELLKGLEEFREHLGGRLTITLISGIGKQHDVHEIDHTKMREAIAVRSGKKEELSC
ncbi:3-dehydroquinate synthase [Flagellimonas sp. DF-77]|uniref:3-dehydroquinate synthase n=1 Tax=Flagellimonas algarum TaxID=3230298 RepID=UPI003394DAB8